MKTILIAVVLGLIGCGGADAMPGTSGAAGTAAAMPLDLTWSIVFNATQWNCRGPMNTHSVVAGSDRITMTGSWNCTGLSVGDPPAVSMGGSMTGLYKPSTADISLSLMSGQGAIPVTGTLGPAGIVGTAHFSGSDVPFTAQ